MSTTNTKIQWTDRTWNPVRGCSRVSPGCDNCYAIGQAHRFAGPGMPFEGLTTLRKGKSDWSGVARFVPSALAEPLSWRKPARIFVNSMSDLFHHSVTDEEIDRVFAVMALARWHTFQVLTKRAERMASYASGLTFERLVAACNSNAEGGEHGPGGDNLASLAMLATRARIRVGYGLADLAALRKPPLPNVWLGVSCEDQQRADERIPHLLATPAAVRFVSAEPLLGPLDLRPYLRRCCASHGTPAWSGDRVCSDACCPGSSVQFVCGGALRPALSWVIVGGESGPGARPCALEWIESVVEQCREADVACFVKQLGAVVVSEYRTASKEDFRAIVGRDPKSPIAPNGEHWAWSMGKRDPKGGDPSEWPSKLRIRQFPEAAK